MSKIEKTTNYGMFHYLVCNREQTEPHIKQLCREIARNNKLEFYPIVVDADYNVMDGQHRLRAAQRLGVPIYYMIDEDAKYEDIGMINSTQKKWKAIDYINHYASLQYPEYIKLKNYLEKKGIKQHNILIRFDSGKNNIAVKNGTYKFFTPEKEQLFSMALEKKDEIVDLIVSKSFLEHKIKSDVINSEAFLRPLISLLAREEVDFNSFRKNFELHLDKFRKCANREAYYNMFVDIYNFGKRNRIE